MDEAKVSCSRTTTKKLVKLQKKSSIDIIDDVSRTERTHDRHEGGTHQPRPNARETTVLSWQFKKKPPSSSSSPHAHIWRQKNLHHDQAWRCSSGSVTTSMVCCPPSPSSK